MDCEGVPVDDRDCDSVPVSDGEGVCVNEDVADADELGVRDTEGDCVCDIVGDSDGLAAQDTRLALSSTLPYMSPAENDAPASDDTIGATVTPVPETGR